LIVAIIAISVLVPLLVLKPLLQDRRLESSLAGFSEIAFLEDVQVVRRSNPPVAILFSDDGAIWEVTPSGLDSIQVSSDLGAEGYEDDKEYFANHIKTEFSIEILVDWDEFKFWRGELALGSGTICPRLHCNYYVLSNGQRAFVWLFTI